MKVEINLIVLHCIFILSLSLIIIHTSRVPVEGESSVCLKKYRKLLGRELVTGCAISKYERYDRARIATCSLLTATDSH